MSKSPIQILVDDPELHAKAKALALVVKDKSRTGAERVLACVEISEIMSKLTLEGLRLEAKEYFERPENQGPKYVWRNGARVKVK